MSYIELNDQNFEENIKKSDIPVVVDFWAPWCAPCRMLAPIFEKLANDYSGKIKFVKVNVDENPTTAIKYMVQGIPTIMLFKDGKPIRTFVGVKPEDEYKKELDNLLNPKKEETTDISGQKGGIININGNQDFENILKNNEDKLIIVDFWAPWCAPCRMLAPTLEKISSEFEDKVIILKVNVDEISNQQLAMQFKVQSIPMLAFIQKDKPIQTLVGALPYENLKKIIEEKLI